MPDFSIGDPFPFYSIYNDDGTVYDMDLQVYFDRMFDHISRALILAWGFLTFADYRKLLYYFFVIELFAIVDYMLIYEHPWFYLGSYGVEFTDFQIMLYVIFAVRWRHGIL